MVEARRRESVDKGVDGVCKGERRMATKQTRQLSQKEITDLTRYINEWLEEQYINGKLDELLLALRE